MEEVTRYGKLVEIDLSESGRQIGEKLCMLLNAKQHMELVRYIHETDSKCDNYYCNDSTFQSELKYGMGQPLTEISIDDLYFGLENRTVMVRGQEIELTAKEFDIFAILIMNPLCRTAN